MKTPRDHILGPDIVMHRHHQMRQGELRRREGRRGAVAFQRSELPYDGVGPDLAQHCDLALA